MNQRDVAAEYVRRFSQWVDDRDAARDWGDYVNGSKLSRADIISECGFGRSVLRQNPGVEAALAALEARLREEGILETDGQAASPVDVSADDGTRNASNQVIEKRLLKAKSNADDRVQALEEQNAVLRAHVGDLRKQLKQFQLIQIHLNETGRLLIP